MSFTAPFTLASRLSLVAGACLALCGAAVQAAAPTQDELGSIVLYGSTTIAQDSTNAWGVWEQIDPPAAGPAQPGTSTPSRSEWYRSLAQVSFQANTLPTVVEPTASLLCAGGSFCGFGRARVTTTTYLPMNEDGTSDSTNFLAYHLVATPVATDGPGLIRAAALPSTADAPAATSTTTFAFSYAVAVKSQALGSSDAVLASESGTLFYNGYGYSAKTAIPNGTQRFSLNAADINSSAFYDNAEILAGWYDNPVFRYINGGSDMSSTNQFQESRGVIGVTTSDADMAALRASRATATYTGHDAYGLDQGSPNMKLNVNFGNGTFTGSLNNGSDGKVEQQTTTRGVQVAGAVGVNIDKGVITGANFMSTALSANDGSIKAGSVVQGAFFGPNAAAAGGVVNITKTTANYSNATFVSPFLTVKDTPKAIAPVLLLPVAPVAPVMPPVIINLPVSPR
jgi:hypothetical protein